MVITIERIHGILEMVIRLKSELEELSTDIKLELLKENIDATTADLKPELDETAQALSELEDLLSEI